MQNNQNVLNSNHLSTTQKLTISAIVIALYWVIMYLTQSFSFGPYQIRIATSLYALSYLYPFLVLPLGLANFLANLLGGSPIDMIGGFFVGILTSYLITLIRRYHLPKWTSALPIIIIPGTMVPIWLSVILSLPYKVLAVSLLIGQILPGIAGVILIKILGDVLKVNRTAAMDSVKNIQN